MYQRVGLVSKDDSLLFGGSVVVAELEPMRQRNETAFGNSSEPAGPEYKLTHKFMFRSSKEMSDTEFEGMRSTLGWYSGGNLNSPLLVKSATTGICGPFLASRSGGYILMSARTRKVNRLGNPGGEGFGIDDTEVI